MQVPLDEVRPDDGTIVWRDPATAERFETPVTGGHAKLQWKPDWAMRWVALGVDYEMAGKDLIDSVKLSGEIARALGGEPPEGFNYELFLDERGQKISKSKGNGLTVDEWLLYGTPESLSLFMYSKPREAKRLFFDVIPRNVDDYLTHLEKYPNQDAKLKLGNPVWHLHAGEPPTPELVGAGGGNRPAAAISFAMLLNLVAVANSEEPGVLWGFIRRYAPDVSPETHPRLDRLVGHAVRYYRDFVRPAKAYRLPSEAERAALEDLSTALRAARGLDGRGRAAGRRLRGRPPAFPGPVRQGQEPGRAPRRVPGLVRHAVRHPARPGARPALRLVRGAVRGRGDAGVDCGSARGRAHARARGVRAGAGGGAGELRRDRFRNRMPIPQSWRTVRMRKIGLIRRR